MAYLSTIARQFQSAKPFPHIVFNEFDPIHIVQELADKFPAPDELDWYRYDNPLEKKLATDKLHIIPDAHSYWLRYMNSETMIQFFQRCTGIQGLIGDPTFRGGGLHQILPGGKLDVHEDYNIHPVLKLKRRLNAIMFLNEDWKESWGGHLELWDNGMTRPVVRIAPRFNTLVLFATDQNSYHGHPEPLACPEGVTRKSMAVYYYTKPDADEPAHSTIYKRRPQDSDELDELRHRRSKGRI